MFAENSIDIQLYLMQNQFPVIPIVMTKNNAAYIENNIKYGYDCVDLDFLINNMIG